MPSAFMFSNLLSISWITCWTNLGTVDSSAWQRADKWQPNTGSSFQMPFLTRESTVGLRTKNLRNLSLRFFCLSGPDPGATDVRSSVLPRKGTLVDLVRPSRFFLLPCLIRLLLLLKLTGTSGDGGVRKICESLRLCLNSCEKFFVSNDNFFGLEPIKGDGNGDG